MVFETSGLGARALRGASLQDFSWLVPHFRGGLTCGWAELCRWRVRKRCVSWVIVDFFLWGKCYWLGGSFVCLSKLCSPVESFDSIIELIRLPTWFSNCTESTLKSPERLLTLAWRWRALCSDAGREKPPGRFHKSLRIVKQSPLSQRE